MRESTETLGCLTSSKTGKHQVALWSSGRSLEPSNWWRHDYILSFAMKNQLGSVRSLAHSIFWRTHLWLPEKSSRFSVASYGSLQDLELEACSDDA